MPPPSPSSSPPLPLTHTLTLILAATHPTLGIGHASTLPWPRLSTELSYFARTTTRAPTRHLNALIMGRTTWESIPARLRPLRGRVNVVVTSRERGEIWPERGREEEEKEEEKERGKKQWLLVAKSLPSALELLQTTFPTKEEKEEEEEEGQARLQLHRIFVIGGAQLYATALAHPLCTRILLTRILKPGFACDVWAPLRVGEDEEEQTLYEGREGEGEGERRRRRRWMRCSREELCGWVGEEVPGGVRREKGVEFEFGMWEREGGREGEGR